jgi:hypothetical protein
VVDKVTTERLRKNLFQMCGGHYNDHIYIFRKKLSNKIKLIQKHQQYKNK